jgi:hypothetical protein
MMGRLSVEKSAPATSPAPADARGAKRARGGGAREAWNAREGDANVPETALEAACISKCARSATSRRVVVDTWRPLRNLVA